jgi:hypothetical protein
LGSESNDSRLSRQNASVLFCCCISELNDRQTRNALEVARINTANRCDSMAGSTHKVA